MAMAHKRSLGEYTGGQAPYGWCVDGTSIAMNCDEQRVIGMIRHLSSRGIKAAEIARELNRLHIAARGSVWHAKSVRRVLERTA